MKQFRQFVIDFLQHQFIDMTSINLRVRTESSEEYSYSGYDLNPFEHSFESISLADESVSILIQTLQKTQEQKARDKHMVSSRSHSYILISEEEVKEKQKCSSMQKGQTQVLQMVAGQVMSQLLRYHRCLNLAKNELYNRAYGAMFGFVIGDAMGAYVINKPFNQQQINQAILMPGGGVLNLKSGEATDQWQICLALSEALIQGKGRYDQNLVAQKYLQWLDSQPFDLPVLMGIAFGQIRKKRRQEGVLNFSTLGEQLIVSSLRNIKQESNLGLIRLIPLVIWSLQLEDYQFNRLITQQMRLITPNSLVRQTALVYGNILRCILKTGDHMLAFHQAGQHICNFGSEQMIELWRCIQDNNQPVMNTATSKNVKLPFIYAINEILQIQNTNKDLNKQFIQSAVNVLSKGFNTDTNCSIVLGLVGAVIGYNSIPSFFRNKIINSHPKPSKKRSRDYHTKRVIEVVDKLIAEGAIEFHEASF